MSKESVQHQFGKNAKAYVNSKIHKEGDDLAVLTQWAMLQGNERVLDVATGGGHTANALAPLAKEVVALDLTKAMLEAAQSFITSNGYQNVNYVLGDALNLPFGPAEFDVVTCRIAAHHFSNIEAFISEVYRVLKPGGLFLLDDNVSPENEAWDLFYNAVEKKRDPSHHRAWKKSEWIRMIELNGFEINQWTCFQKTFRYEDWCVRMQLSAESKIELNDYIYKTGSDIKRKFRITEKDNQVISFQGEAILLSARKF